MENVRKAILHTTPTTRVILFYFQSHSHNQNQDNGSLQRLTQKVHDIETKEKKKQENKEAEKRVTKTILSLVSGKNRKKKIWGKQQLKKC